MKKERLKPGPKPKGHVRINLRGTLEEKRFLITALKAFRKIKINNIEVNE